MQMCKKGLNNVVQPNQAVQKEIYASVVLSQQNSADENSMLHLWTRGTRQYTGKIIYSCQDWQTKTMQLAEVWELGHPWKEQKGIV